MIFCCDFFEKSKHAKFYDAAIDMMRKANGCAFLDRNDFDIFCHLLRRKLKEAMPEGSIAHISVCRNAKGGGQIAVESGRVDDQISRLYFHAVTCVLQYDLDARDFFDVSERLEPNK